MKALITGFEPKELKRIQVLIGYHLPEIQLRAVVYRKNEISRLIGSQKPDVVFLNGELPDGGELVFNAGSVPVDFDIVVILASDRARPVEKSRIHYLSNKIHRDELIALSGKLVTGTSQEVLPETGAAVNKHVRVAFSENLRIPVKEGVFFCPIADIIRVESGGSYSTFYIAGGKRYVVSKGLKEYEGMLPVREFFRVHRSHLVNLRKIRNYKRANDSFLEMEDGTVIEVARRKKDTFQKLMNDLN